MAQISNGMKSCRFLECMLAMQFLSGKSMKVLDATRAIGDQEIIAMEDALLAFAGQLEMDAKAQPEFAQEFQKVANYINGRIHREGAF